MKVGVVKEFRGDYAFLSNHYVNPFNFRGTIFNTGEHAFQAAKATYSTPYAAMHRNYAAARDASTAAQAKALGKTFNINLKDWERDKVQYMREIVHARFATSEKSMVGPLINTGAMLLVEGNTWNDTFWGRCNGKGFNTLGAILMEERGYWLRSGT